MYQGFLNKKRRKFILIWALAFISLGVYLSVSSWTFKIGFPLDDAWIHQTYARNFSEDLRWSFFSGNISGGSTGPLWGFLISLFYFINLAPYVGTFFLGFLLLGGISVLGVKTFSWLLPKMKHKSFFVGCLLLFEWHLVWAAGSGMETLLFSLIALCICGWLVQLRDQWFVLGLLVGVSIWVRPGGVTLLGPIFFVLILRYDFQKILIMGARVVVGFLLPAGLYLLFNLQVAGDLLPNTFYAKQAEYAITRSLPLLQRLSKLGVQPFVGAGIVLLPGFLLFLYKAVKQKAWKKLAGPLWAIGYILLYVWKLPVTYQHGRYLIPTMSVFYIWGFAGFMDWINWKSEDLFSRLMSRTWGIVLGVVTILFWGIGARVYARDVAFIETEMVRAAHWVRSETTQGEVIAAHDIGALGYFTGREIVDLAGLVSPEVIPFIRDEEQIANYLDGKNVDYLITFPFWYPELVEGQKLIYTTNGKFAPRMGMENMAVFDWDADE